MSGEGMVLDGPVATVLLDRPYRHNSLTPEFVETLAARFESAAAAGARAVVLAAEGRSFSTGGDVRAIRDAPDRGTYAERLVGGLNHLLLRMIDLPVPIVAAVHGVVTGGSLGLVLASDVVVVEEQVTFRPWYGTVGFTPDGGWTAILPGIAGPGRVREVLLTDREVTAAEAAAWGIAHRLVGTGGAAAEAASIAGRMAEMDPGSVADAKRLLAGREAVARGLDAEREAFVARVVSDEATAGMDRFLGGESR